MRKIILAIVISLIPMSAYAAVQSSADSVSGTVQSAAGSVGVAVQSAAGSTGATTQSAAGSTGTTVQSAAAERSGTQQSAVMSTSIVIPPYKIGDCVTMLGGKWQQLSDGTWAEPNDPINTCLSGGNAGFNIGMIPGSIANAGSLNGLTGIAALLALNNNSTNLGNLSSNEWFINCVLTQSIIARPECQGLNGVLANSGLYNNLGNTGLLGSVANGLLNTQLGVNSNSNTFFANVGDYGVAVNVPTKDKTTTKILSILSMGWTLSHLF